VALFFNGDDGAVCGEDREQPAEGHVDGRSAAVEQDERHAVGAAVDLVVHLDAVDRGVSAPGRA
jgi:hypothetical protein